MILQVGGNRRIFFAGFPGMSIDKGKNRWYNIPRKDKGVISGIPRNKTNTRVHSDMPLVLFEMMRLICEMR